jgi:hypothetical protein
MHARYSLDGVVPLKLEDLRASAMSQLTAVFLIVLVLGAVSLLGDRGRSGRCCGDPCHRVTESSEIDYCPTRDGRTLLVVSRRP